MTQTEPDNLPATQSKDDAFIGYLFSEPNPYQAAIKAGYSEITAKSYPYILLKKPEFQQRIREYAIQHDLMCLPQLAQIEQQCLKVVQGNPEKYPKFKEIFRQKKQVAGLLAQDAVPAQPTIHIKTIEHLQVVVGDAVQKRLANK